MCCSPWGEAAGKERQKSRAKKYSEWNNKGRKNQKKKKNKETKQVL